MRWVVRLLGAGSGLFGLCCSTTDYALYFEEGTPGGLGGDPEAMSSGGSPTSSGGAAPSSGGSSSGDDAASGCGDGIPAFQPTPVRLYSRQLDLCLSKGKTQELMGSTGFEVGLVPCDNASERLWTVTHDETGALTFESLQSGFNLDVRFADSAPGTPFVLYGAHALYNQRFIVLPSVGDTESLQLSPRHARGMCAEAQELEVQLQRCNPAEPTQFFELIDCSTPL
jgi:Ricin-type beta-trefoil lectin domain